MSIKIYNKNNILQIDQNFTSCVLADKNNNEIITDVYPSGETCKINKYFEEDSRKNRTYIKRSIDYRLLEKSILKQE